MISECVRGTAQTGKPFGNDLKSGKRTAATDLALERLRGADQPCSAR